MAQLKGKVTNTKGKSISGVLVQAGTRSAKTSWLGNYSLGPIPAGPNAVSFSKSGYQALVKTLAVPSGTMVLNAVLSTVAPVPGLTVGIGPVTWS